MVRAPFAKTATLAAFFGVLSFGASAQTSPDVNASPSAPQALPGAQSPVTGATAGAIGSQSMGTRQNTVGTQSQENGSTTQSQENGSTTQSQANGSTNALSGGASGTAGSQSMGTRDNTVGTQTEMNGEPAQDDVGATDTRHNNGRHLGVERGEHRGLDNNGQQQLQRQ